MTYVGSATSTSGSSLRHREGLRRWPLDRHAWKQAALVWVALTVVLSASGLLIARVLDDGAFGRADRRVSAWFAGSRTARVEDVAHVVSALSDTLTVIPVCAVLVAAFAWRWRRWHEAILVVGALLYEKAVFLPVTLVAGRDRPPVGQLDSVPPSSSFFSGHVAAAVALYFGLWMVVRWHTDTRAWRWVAAVLASSVVVAVAWSRQLLGMHHLSDVVVGALVGFVSLVVVSSALAGALAGRADARRTDAAPVASTPRTPQWAEGG
jgi:membrane-associated phospholipid phosphatase